MKIFSQMQTYQPALNQRQNNRNLTTINYQFGLLNCDTVSFGAMKKSEFTGIDRVCIDRFKAPIEKFKENEDLQKWAKKQLEPIMTNVYEGRFPSVAYERHLILDDWKGHLKNPKNDYKNTEKLLIMSAITQNLEKYNETLPPILNKSVLSTVMDKVKNGENINILKTYKKELRESYLKNKFSEKKGEWVVIPSYKNDPENFKKNVEALRVFSNYTWCTHNDKAKPYLEQGDFHVYLENGQPKIGIRFKGDEIQEIQGEKNDGKIPYVYSDIVLERVGNKKCSWQAKTELNDLKIRNANIKTIKNDLKDAIKNNDAEEIFRYLGYINDGKKVKKESNNIFSRIANFFGANSQKSKVKTPIEQKELKIEAYHQPGVFRKYAGNSLDGAISFKDLGIDEDMLLKNVKYIKGNANFSDSSATSLGNVEVIGGDAIFRESRVKDIGKLKRIGGLANFSDSQITSLNDLKKIQGNAIFKYSKIDSLGNLKHIGGVLDLQDSEVKDLGELETIGWSAFFNNSKVTSLKHLKRIGYKASFMNSNVTDLGELEYIGGDAIFINSKIKDTSSIKQIRGEAFYDKKNKPTKLNKSKMKSESALLDIIDV